MKKDTENILVTNYNSLEYSKNMLLALEENTSKSSQEFEVNSIKQEKSLTEIDEKEATKTYKEFYRIYQESIKFHFPKAFKK